MMMMKDYPKSVQITCMDTSKLILTDVSGGMHAQVQGAPAGSQSQRAHVTCAAVKRSEFM